MAENFTLIDGEEIVAEWASFVLTNRRIVGYAPGGGLLMLPICNIHSAGFVTATADWLMAVALLSLLGGIILGAAQGFGIGAILLFLLALIAGVSWAASKSTLVAITAGSQRVAVLLKGHEQPAAVAFCRSVVSAVYDSRD